MVLALTMPSLAPTIEWPNSRLRPLRSSDALDWYAYLSDPVVIEHTSYPVQSRESVQALVESRRLGYAEKTSCTWALVRQSDDKLIGTCGFNSWSLDHAWAELAFDLAREQWGAGLMSHAVVEALQWAFEVVGFNRIHAFVMISNERSIRLLEKSRFAREGLLRSFRIARGTPRDFWIYSVLQAEWSPPSKSGITTA